MRWPIRRRLAVAASVFTALLVLVAGLVVLTEAWRRADAERLDDLEVLADRVDRLLHDPEIPLSSLGIDPNQFVALFDADGLVTEVEGDVDPDAVEESAFAALELETLEPSEILFDEFAGEWDVAAIGCAQGARCDALAVGERPDDWFDFVWERLAVVMAAAVGVGALAGLGSWWLVGRSLRPVDEMRSTLAEITDADLDRRVPVPATGDELTRLGRSMNATLDRLAASLMAQQRFVSDAAHELRSPLTGVRAALELAQRDDERRGEAIDESLREIDRTAALLDDLLHVARVQAGVAARRSLADLDDLARRELRDLESRHPSITVTRGSIQPVQERVDAGGIARMVRNLLDNAAVHARTEVSLSLTDDGDAWRLVVEDDGAGIPVEHRDAVFERFRRLDESRSRATGGSGLGLAIVAGIVADHGGEVIVGDAQLGGARLTVRVPRNADATAVAGASV